MSGRMSVDGVFPLIDTPTTKNTSCSLDSSKDLEDINRLLYLEALKRFKDDEQNIRRHVIEKARQLEIAKSEYHFYYERFIKLYTAATTRAALETENHLAEKQLQSSKDDIETIIRRLNNNKSTGNFDKQILKQCQDVLRSERNFDQIGEVQSTIADQRDSTKEIHGLIEAVHLKLESATIQGLDYFVELAQNKQLESTPNENQNESTLQ